MLFLASFLVIASQLGWREGTPAPILEADPGFEKLYWKSWELLQNAVVEETRLAIFPPRFLAPKGSVSFEEAISLPLYARWGWKANPCIETYNFALRLISPDGTSPNVILLSDGSRQGVASGLPLAPLSGWSLYEITGDKTFLSMILPSVSLRHRLYENIFLQNRGGYLPQGFSPLPYVDDPPAVRESSETLGLLLLSQEFLLKIAKNSSSPAESALQKSAENYRMRLISLFDKETGCYRGKDKDGRPIERLSLVPFWGGIGGNLPTEHLSLRKAFFDSDKFGTKMPLPIVAKSDPAFRADKGCRPLFQYLTLRALMESGQNELAGTLAERILRFIQLDAGEKHILYSEYGAETRNHSPTAEADSLDAGYMTIAALIEAVLGIQVNAEKKTVTWHLRRTDRHGILKLRFADCTVNLICLSRKHKTSSASLEVQTDKTVNLIVRIGEKEWSKKIPPGKTIWNLANES